MPRRSLFLTPIIAALLVNPFLDTIFLWIYWKIKKIHQLFCSIISKTEIMNWHSNDHWNSLLNSSVGNDFHDKSRTSNWKSTFFPHQRVDSRVYQTCGSIRMKSWRLTIFSWKRNLIEKYAKYLTIILLWIIRFVYWDIWKIQMKFLDCYLKRFLELFLLRILARFSGDISLDKIEVFSWISSKDLHKMIFVRIGLWFADSFDLNEMLEWNSERNRLFSVCWSTMKTNVNNWLNWIITVEWNFPLRYRFVVFRSRICSKDLSLIFDLLINLNVKLDSIRWRNENDF